MFIKLIGCVFVITATTCMGLHLSSEFKTRILDLKALKKLILLLRGDINYTNTPLPEAIEVLAERNNGKFQTFFQEVAKKLNELGGISFLEVWKESIKNFLNNTSLTKKDLLQLEQLGENLGYLDKEMQINTIDLYLAQTEEEIKDLMDTEKQKTYMYKGLGILCGFFISIIMF